MKTSYRILALLLLLVLTQPTFGWGATGHELVGDVAERHLTPKTKAAIEELLDGRTLADVSIWADDIKGQRPETRSWHYANAEEGAESYDLERDCGDKSCDPLRETCPGLYGRTQPAVGRKGVPEDQLIIEDIST
jgi:nuclease S1